MKIKNILVGLSIYYNGDWKKIYSHIREKRGLIENNVVSDEKIESMNAIVLLDHDSYPERLKSLEQPPFVLYYKGDISLINKNHILAVVGSRESSLYGKKACTDLLKNLKKDTVIISGLAKGIDTYAHSEALKNGYKTIAVLGSGINNIYPQNNRDLVDKILENGGLILSEYPDEVEPEKDNFIARNRIIAALCKGLLLVESYGRSGAINTSIQALNLGKNIGCVPSEYGKNSNCNRLIKDGAMLIETSEDVDLLF